MSAFAADSDEFLDLSRAISADEYIYATSLSSPIPERLKASVQTQFRYNVNIRDSQGTTLASPDEDLTIGFTTRRTKFGLEGKVTENITGKAKFAFSQSSGAAALEDAHFIWKLSDTVALKGGQFKPALIREENISSSMQLATDRSSANETYNQDYTQGLELAITEDDWRLFFGFNDGFGTDNTYFTSPTEGDFGVTVRGELKFGEASWKQYKQFTSFRGANTGLMLGAAVHHQAMGSTNPATVPTTDMTTATVDASYLGDGWNLFGAGIWRSMDTGLMTLTDGGYVLQGGVFVSDQNEFFARWDLIDPSNSNPIVVGTSGNSDFNVFTFGWNHYIIPESHAAKFTLEIQHYADPTTESIVSIRGNLLPDSMAGQFAATAQIQLLF
jgi:hypothetical protein